MLSETQSLPFRAIRGLERLLRGFAVSGSGGVGEGPCYLEAQAPAKT